MSLSTVVEGTTNATKVVDLREPTNYGLTISGLPFNTNININDLISSNKFVIMNETNLTMIPNLPGNYWILTDEPINHSFNPDFNHRPQKISHNGIDYTVIYNGQGDTIRSRIQAHLYRPKTKGLSDMSGISIDITDKYKQGTIISHNKCLYTPTTKTQKGKKEKKIPYHEYAKKPIDFDDIQNQWGHHDLDEVKDYCKNITKESTIYFKNGIDISEQKHKKYSWLVVYYDMNESLYHPFSDIIEQEWRKIYGSPILCSYKCGR